MRPVPPQRPVHYDRRRRRPPDPPDEERNDARGGHHHREDQGGDPRRAPGGGLRRGPVRRRPERRRVVRQGRVRAERAGLALPQVRDGAPQASRHVCYQAVQERGLLGVPLGRQAVLQGVPGGQAGSEPVAVGGDLPGVPGVRGAGQDRPAHVRPEVRLRADRRRGHRRRGQGPDGREGRQDEHIPQGVREEGPVEERLRHDGTRREHAQDRVREGLPRGGVGVRSDPDAQRLLGTGVQVPGVQGRAAAEGGGGAGRSRLQLQVVP
mmetsp:Transcript_21285/g.49983  ORF Transcript_21285/g.49983 Transcript_21285/m.49983 type:complete len:266 (+) Transcript_21285:366-1163(+)